MSEQLLPDLLTPCTPLEMYSALDHGWRRLMASDGPPTRGSLIVLVAHWGLETGFGHFMHRNNPGNKKHVAGDGHDYCIFRCNELIGGHILWVDGQFAAFPDLDSGAADYLVGLRGRFRAAWPAVLAGDPSAFCHALKLQRYYTADEATYTAGVVRCFRQLDASLPVIEQNIEMADPHDTSTAPEVPNPTSDPELPPNV